MIAAMYFYFLQANRERPFILETLYKFHVIFMILVSLAYLVDAELYLMNKTTFCKLQSEYKRDKCDSMNKYFLWQVGLFFIFWLPLWWGAAAAHKRLSEELKENQRGFKAKDDFNVDPRTQSKRQLIWVKDFTLKLYQ